MVYTTKTIAIKELALITLPFDSIEHGYRGFYESLSELRELFHSTGRFDDSNAKLDEIAKLLVIYLSKRNGQLEGFEASEDDLESLVQWLQTAFQDVALRPAYLSDGKTSIFGQSPSLLLRPSDGAILKQIIKLVEYSIDAAFANKSLDRPFDVVNEAFGHFIRDNFRGNIEDAQYMTPPEVVEFMVEMAMDDIPNEFEHDNSALTVVDPSCGVGSFLTAFYHHYTRKKLQRPLNLVGQDKVERMVRLSKINLELFGSKRGDITIGNSLLKGSALDALNGKVDIILTNPPFGARIDVDDIQKCGENLSIFSDPKLSSRTVDSELLFLDRNLSLLKEGGKLFIVVPDSVVSAGGPASVLRQHIRAKATLKAVIELPAVTFAQAGTRTRTVVLCVEKQSSKTAQRTIFAKSESLGFEVKARKGVQIKVLAGSNDLPQIQAALHSNVRSRVSRADVLSAKPSIVSVPYSYVLNGSWTPNHYHSDRILALEQLKNHTELTPSRIGDFVNFVTDRSKPKRQENNEAFIGVLHVLSEGVLDMKGIMSYTPITPGIRTKANDILLSKINPRIPRIVVVPDISRPMLCSSEFEVMRVKDGIDPYMVAFMLNSNFAQRQISSLTSGTSASHNRIKTNDLANVLLPIPAVNSKTASKMQDAITRYRTSIISIAQAYANLAEVESERCAELT